LEVPVHEDETIEFLPGRGLRFIQKKRGYRYCLDAILLASFCRLNEGHRVVDLGTGNAVIPILLAARGIRISIVGVEVQGELLDLARRNVLINGLEGTVTLVHRDVRDLGGSLGSSSFDVAISNPPYRRLKTGRINPDPQKALARHEILGSLEDMARAASSLLRTRARFYVVYPASRLADMLSIMRRSDLEPKRIRLVHPSASEEAKLVLAEAVKGGRGELRVLAPLIVHDLEGSSTSQIDEIYKTLQES